MVTYRKAGASKATIAVHAAEDVASSHGILLLEHFSFRRRDVLELRESHNRGLVHDVCIRESRGIIVEK